MTRHYARKVDGNHAAIVGELRACGLHVLDMSRLGNGAPDLLVAHGDRQVLVEVKDGRGKLTQWEQEFFDGWPDALVIVARGAEDVLSYFGMV